jgi:hypothetical protein
MSSPAVLRIGLREIGEKKDKLKREEAGILREFIEGLLNSAAIHRLAETRGCIAELCDEEAHIQRKISQQESVLKAERVAAEKEHAHYESTASTQKKERKRALSKKREADEEKRSRRDEKGEMKKRSRSADAIKELKESYLFECSCATCRQYNEDLEVILAKFA